MQVLLVGGFARSPYLETQLRRALQQEPGCSGLRVYVPPEPHAAVLNGELPHALPVTRLVNLTGLVEWIQTTSSP